ncbi:hypothetical protein [Azospirillum brasilense]|uniref:hypothetical protein n=1 Tax=Azospirillum brasilense TaxID=192 RepID=UPI0013B43323|nr:hypothetical protein [Azospirillum brasilense]
MTRDIKPENEKALIRYLKQAESSNNSERAESRLESIKRTLRAEIVRNNPFASSENVEAILEQRLMFGAKPTNAGIKKKPPFKPAVGPDRLFRLKKRR